MDKFITVPQAAEYCGKHQVTIRRALNRRELKGSKTSASQKGHWSIRVSDLDAWMNRGGSSMNAPSRCHPAWRTVELDWKDAPGYTPAEREYVPIPPPKPMRGDAFIAWSGLALIALTVILTVITAINVTAKLIGAFS